MGWVVVSGFATVGVAVVDGGVIGRGAEGARGGAVAALAPW